MLYVNRAKRTLINVNCNTRVHSKQTFKPGSHPSVDSRTCRRQQIRAVKYSRRLRIKRIGLPMYFTGWIISLNQVPRNTGPGRTWPTSDHLHICLDCCSSYPRILHFNPSTALHNVKFFNYNQYCKYAVQELNYNY